MLQWFFVLSWIVTGSALAQNLSFEEFEARTKNRTFTFSKNGVVYGAERYFGNGLVEWSFLDGSCLFGRYFEWQGKICFAYDEFGQNAENPPQCWTFEPQGDTIIALFFDPYKPQTPVIMAPTDTELVCPGPDVGI